MPLIMSLRGLNFSNSEIELYDDRITVKHFLLPRREIPVKSITRVWYFSKAGLLGPGIMNVSYKNDKGSIKTVDIYYNHGGVAGVEKLRTALESMRNGGAAPAPAQPQPGAGQTVIATPPVPFSPSIPPAPPVTPGAPASSNAGEIEKLAGLKAKGIITDDEFEAKKHQLLFGDKGGPVLREREIVREIVKVPCAYCGVLMDITNSKCPTCGAPVNRR